MGPNEFRHAVPKGDDMHTLWYRVTLMISRVFRKMFYDQMAQQNDHKCDSCWVIAHDQFWEDSHKLRETANYFFYYSNYFCITWTRVPFIAIFGTVPILCFCRPRLRKESQNQSMFRSHKACESLGQEQWPLDRFVGMISEWPPFKANVKTTSPLMHCFSKSHSARLSWFHKSQSPKWRKVKIVWKNQHVAAPLFREWWKLPACLGQTEVGSPFGSTLTHAIETAHGLSLQGKKWQILLKIWEKGWAKCSHGIRSYFAHLQQFNLKWLI